MLLKRSRQVGENIGSYIPSAPTCVIDQFEYRINKVMLEQLTRNLEIDDEDEGEDNDD